MGEPIRRIFLAEFTGTALLLISVVGSGIMGETLANGNMAIALLANAIATGCMLYCIITLFGPISSAHFNPVVTLAFYCGVRWRRPQPFFYLIAGSGRYLWCLARTFNV